MLEDVPTNPHSSNMITANDYDFLAQGFNSYVDDSGGKDSQMIYITAEKPVDAFFYMIDNNICGLASNINSALMSDDDRKISNLVVFFEGIGLPKERLYEMAQSGMNNKVSQPICLNRKNKLKIANNEKEQEYTDEKSSATVSAAPFVKRVNQLTDNNLKKAQREKIDKYSQYIEKHNPKLKELCEGIDNDVKENNKKYIEVKKANQEPEKSENEGKGESEEKEINVFDKIQSLYKNNTTFRTISIITMTLGGIVVLKYITK